MWESILAASIWNIERTKPRHRSANPPLILWNQRWEYDKNPDGFLCGDVYALADEDIPFQSRFMWAAIWEKSSVIPNGLEKLSDRIIHIGYASPERYAQLVVGCRYRRIDRPS